MPTRNSSSPLGQRPPLALNLEQISTRCLCPGPIDLHTKPRIITEHYTSGITRIPFDLDEEFIAGRLHLTLSHSCNAQKFAGEFSFACCSTRKLLNSDL